MGTSPRVQWGVAMRHSLQRLSRQREKAWLWTQLWAGGASGGGLPLTGDLPNQEPLPWGGSTWHHKEAQKEHTATTAPPARVGDTSPPAPVEPACLPPRSYLLLLLQLLLLGIRKLRDTHQTHGLPLLVAKTLEVLN